jgi:hypothetical protein
VAPRAIELAGGEGAPDKEDGRLLGGVALLLEVVAIIAKWSTKERSRQKPPPLVLSVEN